MHTHVWTPCEDFDDCFWQCTCGEMLEGSDITRRLNAVEMLSAEQAYAIGKEGPRGETAIGPLLAYSRILEGETT